MKMRMRMRMNNSQLAAMVFATLKFSRLRASHQAATRFGLASGGRRVLDELPSDLASAAPTTDVDDSQLVRQREIVQGQIREFTSNPVYWELIERRLFGGESIGVIAEDLQLLPPTARSTVARASRYLGLTE